MPLDAWATGGSVDNRRPGDHRLTDTAPTLVPAADPYGRHQGG
ncbi:hypothetical protein [Plantactinospora sp. KLBMP9567]|nr:hypothetical protein [Plantactinospora sp. KLBMP9567]MDW5322552.1 hypothetical protein [Plantactinospora sp. KLBMP9567]